VLSPIHFSTAGAFNSRVGGALCLPVYADRRELVELRLMSYATTLPISTHQVGVLVGRDTQGARPAICGPAGGKNRAGQQHQGPPKTLGLTIPYHAWTAR